LVVFFAITVNSGSDSSFVLPIKPDTINNLAIDWGDGSTQIVKTSPSTGTTYTGIPHTFPTANTNYQIKMYGTSIISGAPSFSNRGKCGFGFSNTAGYNVVTNKSKIISIDSDIMSLIPEGTELGVYFLFCCFQDCTSLTSIPDNFLNGLTSQQKDNFLYHCFYNCTSLTSIPDDFLSGLTGQQGAYSLHSCFYGCISLTSASPVNGDSIKLYDRVSGTGVGTRCFYNCTQMADYASIPASWKSS
jgi:hypothetical protein